MLWPLKMENVLVSYMEVVKVTQIDLTVFKSVSQHVQSACEFIDEMHAKNNQVDAFKKSFKKFNERKKIQKFENKVVSCPAQTSFSTL